MSFELDESQWFDLQPDTDSEYEDIRQESQDCSVSNSLNTTSKCQITTQSIPSTLSIVYNGSRLSDSQSVSTHNSNVSLLSQHSLPVSSRSKSCISNYSLNPRIESKSDSLSCKSLSQHSLPISSRSLGSHIHNYSLNSRVESTSDISSSKHYSSNKDYSSSNDCSSGNDCSSRNDCSSGKALSRCSPQVSSQSSGSHIHNYGLNSSGQTTSFPSCSKDLSLHNLSISNRSSNSCIHNYSLNTLVKSASHSSSRDECSGSKNCGRYRIRVSGQPSSDAQTPSTSNISSLNQYSLSSESLLSKSSHNSLQNTVISTVQTDPNSDSGVAVVSHHDHAVLFCDQTDSKNESGHFSLSQHSLLAVSSVQTNSKSDLRVDKLAVPDHSNFNFASHIVVGSEYSLRMYGVSSSGLSSIMDDSASQQFETLLPDSSQDSTTKFSSGQHGYSTDDTSDGLGLSEYPIERLTRSPISDQAATEDNSECEEVVQSAISEVYKDFLSGKYSPSNVLQVESDSSQLSSDNEGKLAESSFHGKYPETAAGMSDNDWNPYVTESDSNVSPRLEAPQSSVRATSVSTVSQFSPPLSSTANGTCTSSITGVKTTPMSTVSLLSNELSTGFGSSSSTTVPNSVIYRTGSDHLTGRHYGYASSQSSFTQNIARSEGNLRSFLGRNLEKRHLESRCAAPPVAGSDVRQSAVCESVSKDQDISAQHAATYLTKSHPTEETKEMSVDIGSSYKQKSLDDDKNYIVSHIPDVISAEKTHSQIPFDKQLLVQSSAQSSCSNQIRPLYSQSDFKVPYSSSLPEKVSKCMENLPQTQTLADGASKVLTASDEVLDRRVRDSGKSYSYKKDKKPNHQFSQGADAIEQEVLSTEPTGSDYLTGNALSQSYTSVGSTHSSTSKEVQHLIGNRDHLEHSSTNKKVQHLIGNGDHLEHFSTNKKVQHLIGNGDHLEHSSSSKEMQDLLWKRDHLEIKAETEHFSLPGGGGDGMLRNRVRDILTKTSYLEQDPQVMSAEAERMLFDASRLPSSIDYSQLQHDLQQIQKSLHNFSDRDDSESGSECSVKLDSKESSFAGSGKEGTIIPSTTTTPDRLPVQRQDFRAGLVGNADGQLSVRTSQEDETDQSDDLRKHEQFVQNGKKGTYYNSEGEETHGSSSSAKGESDSGQRTPTFTSQHRSGEIQDVDEFLQNVRYQRSLIQSQTNNHSNSFSNVSGMAEQISDILEQDNPRTQAHGILKEVHSQERQLSEQIAGRRPIDLSFTDTSANYSQGSLIITDEDVRKRLHLSGLSSLETSSCGDGYSDLSTSERSQSPFSAFKEARRFMSKQMEMVQERSFNHSIELTPYRTVLSAYPVYGFKKDCEEEQPHGSSRRTREHSGVREAWLRHQSHRSQLPEAGRKHPEGTSEDSSSPSRIPKLLPTVDLACSSTERQVATSMERRVATSTERQVATSTERQVATSMERRVATSTERQVATSTERRVATSTKRQLPVVVRDVSEARNLPTYGDEVGIDCDYSITERRIASSPAGDVWQIKEQMSTDSSQVPLVQEEHKIEPSEAHDVSDPSSYGVPSPAESDGSTSRRRERYRPYRPAGSRDMYYTESDTTDSITTMESTHTGSDDAVPPYFPSDVLGSRKDTQMSVTGGIHGTKPISHGTQLASGISLSTIEERSVVDDKDKERPTTSSSRSSNENSSLLDEKRQYQTDIGTVPVKSADVSDSRGEEGMRDLSPASLRDDQSRLLSKHGGHDEETYRRQEPQLRMDADILWDDRTHMQAGSQMSSAVGGLEQAHSTHSSDQMRQISGEPVMFEKTGEKVYHTRDVLVRDCATSPIIIRPAEPITEKPSQPLTTSTVGSRMAPRSSVFEENNVVPVGTERSYGEARNMRLVSNHPQIQHQDLQFTQQQILHTRGESVQPQSTEVDRQFTVYESSTTRKVSGPAPQTSVVFSSQYSSPHVHSTVHTSQDFSSLREESSLNDFVEQPGRQNETQNDHPQQESTPSRRPRSGRSEMRDRIVQERNNRIPDNSTSEEEIEQKIDRTPISRKAQLLRQTLEQEMDLSIAPNINTMWQRFQELNSTETESTMDTSRMETFSHIIPNPTKHAVQLYFSQREQGRQQLEEKVIEERETRRKVAKDRDSSSAKNLNDANLNSFDGKSNPKADCDTLYSIPEDSFGSPSKLKSPNKKRHAVIDPHMGKLRDKIQRQKDKIDKERKKELRRMEKLMKLENLLKAKRKGHISSRDLSQSIDDVSSTSVPTESSPEFTSCESTITASSCASDTPTEETTAKDSSAEMHLAKMAKECDVTLEDSSGIGDLYQEAVRKYFHSKDKERRSEEDRTRKEEKRQMSKENAKQKHKQTKGHSYSLKENVESFDSFLHRRQVEVYGRESRNKCLGKGKKTGGFSPRKGRTQENFSTSNNKDFSAQHKLRRTQSDAIVQTSPCVRMSGPRVKSRSPSPRHDGVPVISLPVMTKRSRSASPPFSTRFTPETQGRVSVKNRKKKPASKGVAWFVELKDDRPSRESVTVDPVWKRAVKIDRAWREPLKERQEKVKEVLQARPLVDQNEELSKKGDVKEMISDTRATESLQNAFSEHMAWFISRSRERQKRLELAARERHMQECFRMEHERLFGDRRKHANVNLETHPISEHHYKPQKRLLSKQEQKELTENCRHFIRNLPKPGRRIYNQLPEVVNGKRKRRVELQKQLNRLRARVFNKKVQRVVLMKAGVFA